MITIKTTQKQGDDGIVASSSTECPFKTTCRMISGAVAVTCEHYQQVYDDPSGCRVERCHFPYWAN